MIRVIRFLSGFLFLCLVFPGCGLPRDPGGTLREVQNGTLRVGLVEAPGFAEWESGEPTGKEVELVRRLADSLKSQLVFVPLSLDQAVDDLKNRRVKLVIGGFTNQTPVKAEVGLTLPYQREPERVFLTPPGENEWLLMR